MINGIITKIGNTRNRRIKIPRIYSHMLISPFTKRVFIKSVEIPSRENVAINNIIDKTAAKFQSKTTYYLEP